MKKNSEFSQFESVLKKVLKVSRKELAMREEEWKSEKEKNRRKRANASPASRASGDPV